MKLRKMDTLDIILGLEGGEVLVEDMDDLQVVKNICKDFARSQGFYGRLLQTLEDAEITEDNLPIIL